MLIICWCAKSLRTNLPQPRAVLFDLDGTLADSVKDLGEALNRMLTDLGRPPIPYARYRHFGSDGANGMLRLGFAHEDEHQRQARRTDYLRYYRQTGYQQTALYAGVGSVLQFLQQAAIPWGIVTNKPRQLAVELTERLPALQQCALLYGGDSFAVRKPDPLPLLAATESLATAAQDCWYIGDAKRDMDAANAAGMVSVLAQWGYFPPEAEPDAWQVQLRCPQPQALLQHLQENHKI